MAEKFLVEYLRLSLEDGDVVSWDGDTLSQDGGILSQDGSASSQDEKTESDSITHQREIIRRYRKERNLYPDTQALEITDDGYSGTNFQRPGMERLLSMVRDGKVCCIIVKDLSRFGRDYLTVGDYLEQVFPFMGVRFIAVNDGYDSDDYAGTTGGLEVAFKNLMYDLYSKDLSVKMRSALEIRRKRGDFIGPRPPFGYQFSDNKKKLAVDETAAMYVKRVFWLACEGYSTGEIAVKLNEERIPTPGYYKNQQRGNPAGGEYHILDGKGYWDRKKVLKILENRTYLGTVVNGKYKVTEVGGSRFQRIPDEERIYVADRHEAIITEEEFTRASKVIKNRGCQKGKVHHYGNGSALLGKVKCAGCRKSMVRIVCTKIPCYACERTKYDKDSRCFHGQRKEPEIEAEVLKQIGRRLAMQKAEYRKLDIGSIKSSIREARKEIALSEARIDSVKVEKQYLYEQFKLGQIDRRIYLEKVEALRREEDKLRNDVEQVQQKIEELERKKEKQDNRNEMLILSREAADEFVEAVYVHADGRLEVIWKKE